GSHSKNSLTALGVPMWLFDKELFLRHPYPPIPNAAARTGITLGDVMERRANRRFRIKLPMRVRWTTKSGNGEAQPESEDITSRGVYFFLPIEIENGSWVELVIVLPQEITLAEPVCARCHGRV